MGCSSSTKKQKNIYQYIFTQLEDKNRFKSKKVIEVIKKIKDEQPEIFKDPSGMQLNIIAKEMQKNSLLLEAQCVLENAIEYHKKIFGQKHQQVATDHFFLGKIYIKQKNFYSAYEQFKQCLLLYKTCPQDYIQNSLEIIMKISMNVIMQQGDIDMALKIQKEILTINFGQSIPFANELLQQINLVQKVHNILQKYSNEENIQTMEDLENVPCTICSNQLEKEQSFVSLPCQHQFHTDCIAGHLLQQQQCPICKFSF